MIPFIFVTGSDDKAIEAERILRVKVERHNIDLPEIQAVEVEEVIAYKAKFAYEVLGKQPVMIEDTGLYIEAWNGLPGALIKWFIQRAGVSGICQMMKEFPNKSAWAKTIIGTYDGQVMLFTGQIPGRIADEPRGECGFGWDPIFIPEGSDKTFGEMTPVEKDKFSMRRLAFEDVRSFYLGGL